MEITAKYLVLSAFRYFPENIHRVFKNLAHAVSDLRLITRYVQLKTFGQHVRTVPYTVSHKTPTQISFVNLSPTFTDCFNFADTVWNVL